MALDQAEEGVAFLGFTGLPVAKDKDDFSLYVSSGDTLLRSLQKLSGSFVPAGREPAYV